MDMMWYTGDLLEGNYGQEDILQDTGHLLPGHPIACKRDYSTTAVSSAWSTSFALPVA